MNKCYCGKELNEKNECIDHQTLVAAPFANGTEFTDWVHENCWRCEKGRIVNKPTNEAVCLIESRLWTLGLSRGGLEWETANRMAHYQNPGKKVWECGEFKPIELGVTSEATE